MHNTWDMTIQSSWSYRLYILFQLRGTNILEMSNAANWNATTIKCFKKIHVVHGLLCNRCSIKSPLRLDRFIVLILELALPCYKTIFPNPMDIVNAPNMPRNLLFALTFIFLSMSL